jgi:fatty-acyl-CoA synthase
VRLEPLPLPETSSLFPAEWWSRRPGDIGTIDEAGYCRIVGRSKDLIICGGVNIYPREVEEFLYRHPAIEEVSVVGIPDQLFGEKVRAWIKLHAAATLSDREVRNYCAGHIAHDIGPKVIRFVDEFPMAMTGKIQKYEIRKIMDQECGLGLAD